MSVIAAAQGTVSLTDTVSGSTTLSKTLNNTVTGSLSSFGQNAPIGTSPTSVSVPNSLAQFVYIKNLSTTSGNTLTVNWTVLSGGAVNVAILDPGATLILSQNGTNGIIALSLTANMANTPVEFILAG